MSDFIKYNRRSVALPPGFKDLIDVSHPVGLERLRAHIDRDLSGTMVRSGSIRGKFCEIGNYVQMAFSSQALAFTLHIHPADDSLTFNVARVNGGTMWASVVIEEDTAPAAAVRDFFAHHGLQLPEDASTPGRFFPHAPVHLICRISPMPSDAAILSSLATALFREVCGLSDESEVCYDHAEMVNA